jgi:hypothetical protein
MNETKKLPQGLQLAPLHDFELAETAKLCLEELERRLKLREPQNHDATFARAAADIAAYLQDQESAKVFPEGADDVPY